MPGGNAGPRCAALRIDALVPDGVPCAAASTCDCTYWLYLPDFLIALMAVTRSCFCCAVRLATFRRQGRVRTMVIMVISSLALCWRLPAAFTSHHRKMVDRGTGEFFK